MDARESLAKGSRRNGDLCDHICVDQWATAEDPSFESACRSFARRGDDGFDRCNGSRAGLSLGQLRHAGPVARDDADLGISLSGALFRMGGGGRSEVLEDTAAALVVSDAYFRNSVGATRQRYDLSDVDPFGGRGHPSWETSAAAVPDRAGDQRQYRERWPHWSEIRKT